MAAEPRTISELGRALRDGRTTAESVTGQCLQRIAKQDPAINAFIAVYGDEALAQARAADRDLAAGRDRGPLHGVPISLKDLIDVAGMPTTAASRVRSEHIAASDAPIVRRLRAAGAVLVGKTNLHEFALGTTNEDSAYGPVRHPLDPTRGPGGSSGGSAASVLAGMAFASIGTDTGGSIRIPAAACGLVGLKPALGDIDTAGLVPLSATLDHVGPLCRSVEDAATLYEVLGGSGGPEGPPLRRTALRPTERATREAKALRVAVLRGYFTALLDADVAAAFDAACERLRAAGVTLVDASIPHAADVGAIYLHIVLTEAAEYHAPTLERRGADYTAPVRLRLETGRYILAEDYARALRGRAVLRHEVDAALADVDALLLPSLAIPAPKIGAETVRIGNSEEPVRGIMLRLTQLFNVTGHPAISVPCGTTPHGLPVGVQLVGVATRQLLDAAAQVEAYVGPGRSL